MLSIASGLAIFGICFMKNAMELEDAEQAFYSQWFRWGYDDQPPLYTWLQIAINKILGISKGSFAFLRAIIFSLTLVAFYKFSKRFLNNKTAAVAVVLSLVLIPTFIDFTFRRLSHTSLLCLMVILTYVLIHRLVERKSLFNYAALGLVIGVGFLTKYNYALLIAALGCTVFTSREIRKVFFNKWMFLTIILAAMLLLPHLFWLFGETGFSEELQSSVGAKTNAAATNGIPLVSPLISLFLSFLKLAWPLLAFCVILIFRKKLKKQEASINNKWTLQLFIAQLLVFVLVFVAMNVQKVEARWLLPMMIPFLVLLPKYFKEEIILKWNQIGYIAFLAVIVIQVMRTPIEKTFGIDSSVHYGFDVISDKLQTNFSEEQWFLPDVTYAGNIRLLNQDRKVFALDDFSLSEDTANLSKVVYVVKSKSKARSNTILKDSIMSFGKDKEDLYFYLSRH